MSLLDLHRSGSYSAGGPSAPAPSKPPPVRAEGEDGGRRLPKPKTLREKRQEWGREWGRINSEIGKQLRERGK